MSERDSPRRPYRSQRGSPRPPPGVQKALVNFGVSDLREKLNQMHLEKDRIESNPRKQPPPDPSYNYLKDPTRETQRPTQQRVDKIKPNTSKPRRDADNNYAPAESKEVKKELRFAEPPHEIDSKRGRGGFSRRGRGGPPRNIERKIENPFNIKVELSTETGQRSCVLDETTKLPDIKHVPDKPSPPQRSRSFRGRGRGSFRPNRNSKSESELQAEQSSSNVIQQAAETDTKKEANNDSFETEDFVDSNENYDENVEKSKSDEAHKSSPSFEANLVETITITSSKFQDGEVERLVEVKPEESKENLS